MARSNSPARLIIALSVAAVLAVFLLYTSIAGGGTPQVSPSELEAGPESVSLVGLVVGPITGDAHGSGLRFALKDIEGSAPKRVKVVYTGSVPDQFKLDRHVVVSGAMRGGVFVATKDSMITKCPSKYQAADTSSN